MEGFDHVHREHVRFNDLDSLGHVNNAVYATYFESARLAFLGSRSFNGMILARLEIDFRSPAVFGEKIEIATRPAHVGTKSFALEQRLHAAGRLAAESRSVLVSYDYENAVSRPLTDDQKRRLAA